jgi:tryptophan synthase beta chain
MPALTELSAAAESAWKDPKFRRELAGLLHDFVGRPTPLYPARGLSRDLGRGIQVWLKREDLCHTGSHKLNNVIGQLMLAHRMGKRRIIAETGAGQHGVATATGAALFGMECVVYMGEEDMRRQALNVSRMRQLGATVKGVSAGTQTLKDAINEAFRDWVASVNTTHYCFGTVAGPHPFPLMVRRFQSVIGREARSQSVKGGGRLPTHVIACVGGGSNAIGIFSGFIADRRVRLIGVEAGGRGGAPGQNASTLGRGRPGILHGSLSMVLQDRDGQVLSTHSIAAGLDYPGVGPEHAWLQKTGRAEYRQASDTDAIEGFMWAARREGILPALESSHALGWLKRNGPRIPRGSRIILNLSGRGDKDADTVGKYLETAASRASKSDRRTRRGDPE